MPQKNKLALGVGLTLIVIAFLVTFSVVFFSGQAAKDANKQLSSLEVELANIISERAQEYLSSSDAKRVKRNSIDLEDFLAKAESVYGEEERSRKEGVLWLDRKAETYMVTLGAVNGVTIGSVLGIFEGDDKIGEVVIDIPFDVISYAEPVDMSLDDFASNYYRVAVVDQP